MIKKSSLIQVQNGIYSFHPFNETIYEKAIVAIHPWFTFNDSGDDSPSEYSYPIGDHKKYKKKLELLIKKCEGAIFFLESYDKIEETINDIYKISNAKPRFFLETEKRSYLLKELTWHEFASFLKKYYLSIDLIGGFLRGDITYVSKNSSYMYGCLGAAAVELREKSLKINITNDLTFNE